MLLAFPRQHHRFGRSGALTEEPRTTVAAQLDIHPRDQLRWPNRCLPQPAPPLQHWYSPLFPLLVVTKGTNYTSGPKLISAATPQKPTAATTAAVHVVATTPVKTREANIIDGSLFCGGWVINSRRRLQP